MSWVVFDCNEMSRASDVLVLNVGDRTVFNSEVHGKHFGIVESATQYRDGYCYTVRHDCGSCGIFFCEGKRRNNNQGLEAAPAGAVFPNDI